MEKFSKLYTKTAKNTTIFNNQRSMIRRDKKIVVFLSVNRKPKFTNRKPKRKFGLKTEPNRNRKLQNRTEPKTEKTLRMLRLLLGRNCPWAQLSGRNCTWAQLSMGAIVHGRNCPWAQLSGRNCTVTKNYQ